MSRTHQMAFELAGKIHSTFTGAFQGASSQVQQLGARARELERAFEQAGDGTGLLTQEQRGLQRQLEYTRERMRGLQRIAGADLTGNLRRVGTEMRRVGTRAAGLATGAAAGIFGLAKSTADLGDEAAKTANKLGMNAEAYMELRYAAERTGMSGDKFSKTLESMSRRIGQAAEGTGEAQRALEQLGLSAHELRVMSPEEQLETIAREFQHLEHSADRSAIAADLFTRQGIDMINMLEQGPEGMRQLRDAGREAGAVLGDEAREDAERFQDGLLRMQTTLSGLRHMLGAQLMPVVTNVMDNISNYVSDSREQVQEFANTFAVRVQAAIPIMRDIGQGVWRVATLLGSLIRTAADLVGGFDRLAMIVAGLFTAKLVIAVAALGKSLVMVASGVGILVKAWLGLNAAMLVSPLFYIPAILAAIAAGGYLLVKNWDWVKEKLGAAFTWIADRGRDMIQGIRYVIMNFTPLGMFIEKFNKVREWISNFNLSDAGKAIIETLVSGIKSMASAPIDAVKNVAGNVRDMLPFSDAKEGPFSDLTKAGMAIPKTLGEGLKRATPDFQQRAKQVLAGGMAAIPLMSTPDMAGAEPRIQDQFARATIQPEHIQSRDPLDQRLDAPSQQNLSSPAVNINQTFEINGTAGSDPDARRVGEEAGKQARRAVEDFFRREQRLSYA